MAVKMFRTKYNSMNGGEIGITLDSPWLVPLDPTSQRDIEATARAMTWHLAWYADPLYVGDYPQVMKERVGDRLPKFTDEEKELLKGSTDFFGLNHYWTNYIYHSDHPDGEGYFYDRGCMMTPEKDGVLIGPQGDSSWFYVVPWGMRGLLNWIWNKYSHPEIYITENGVDIPHESTFPLKEALNDTFRVNFYRDYLAEIDKAINIDGVQVMGYMAWSLLDNFEWADGLTKRFGVVYIDYQNNLTRYPKSSYYWYRDFIKENRGGN
jgi:beta-glucosidase